LPERVEGENGLILRRWVLDDAEQLAKAVSESVEHLRPWMEWVSQEPLSLKRRREMLTEWEQQWRRGGDVTLGVFLDGEVAGGCGLHRRLGPAGLEIGYWTHPSFLRRGVATNTARLLTSAAFTLPEITHVEIHHDKANEASGGVPRRLGYQLVEEAPDEPEAPAEVGTECRWRMTRQRWTRRSALASS
jgi:RimJ/RimL family protein N-acetyltransferase